jgi:hypothetical protein
MAEGNRGGGVILRYHHGSFIGGACHFFAHVADAEGTELQTCKQGLLLAREFHQQKIIPETDCSGIAAKLTNVDQDRSI